MIKTSRRCINCVSYKKLSKRRGLCKLMMHMSAEDNHFIDSRTGEPPQTSELRAIVPSFCCCMHFQAAN
ncbi:MAG TPA: hypothetical protein EYN69_11325 [Flavobacteriales bacterium]|nr:hypothetical protein [Flavobacteriales bacterium]